MKTFRTLSVLIILAVLSPLGLRAQNTVQTGEMMLQLGIGPAYGYSVGGYDDWGFTPFLYANLQIGAAELGPGVLSVGGMAGVQTYRRDWRPGWAKGARVRERFFRIPVLGRAEWHHGFDVANFDFYAAIMAGLYFTRYDNDNDDFDPGDDYTDVDFALSPRVGAKYYFAENIGVFGEAGYGLSFFTLGLDLKL